MKVQNELFIADIEAKNNEFTNLKVRITLIWSPLYLFYYQVQSQNIEHVSKRRKNEMAEAMRFHLYTLNQMERRQEQMRILDKEIAKGLSKNFKNFSPIGPTGMHLPVILRHTHLPDQDSSWKISVKVAHFSGQTAEN